MKTILVTGGAGFIGSAVCRMLVTGGRARVVNIDKLTYAANLHSLDSLAGSNAYQFAKADICDRTAMDGVFAAHNPDGVIHLAAESHVDRSITGSRAFVDTNVIGTFTLLEAARAYWQSTRGARRDDFRFVHVSTDEVFGSLGETGLFSEETRYDPSSPYSATKAASDHLVRAWTRTYGLPAVVTNCSNNFGPFQFPEKLIPLMILNAMAGKDLPVYGNGSNVRDWLYVDDHAEALWLALTRGTPGNTYNVGGGNERSNLAVVKSICAIMDRLRPAGAPHDRLIRFVADRPGHDQRYAVDVRHISQNLGWSARENFDSGLEKTIAWYLANESWWAPLRERVYGGERLGLADASPKQA